MDLKAAMETPVYSAAPGIIVLAKNLFYTGNTVMMDHGYGVVTLYAHMNELKVKVGEVVPVHKLLGLSGKTGRVSGPHLHWQAVVHHVKVNPIGLTEVMR
jgi:murein DD-endopeptidase MepM/ murein hydrolase activator NlpD